MSENDVLIISFLFCTTTTSTISVIFNVDPDTHIDSIEQAESAVLEGTANWSAKIAVTGTKQKTTGTFVFFFAHTIDLNLNK